MGESATIDARMQAALARLTENEKECLRRRLRQQTAKEMALELGVSPHAVEKRLKMARAKLGLSSSLEAARLLAASEGYQRSGPQSSDLPVARSAGDGRRYRQLMWGVPIVIIAAAALAFLAPTAGVAPPSGGVAPYPGPSGVAPVPDDREPPTAAEQIDAVVTENFKAMDQDRSGFLEADEIPAPAEEARHAAIAAGDTNRDGKLTFVEYRAWLEPIIAGQAAEGRKYVEEYLSRTSD